MQKNEIAEIQLFEIHTENHLLSSLTISTALCPV